MWPEWRECYYEVEQRVRKRIVLPAGKLDPPDNSENKTETGDLIRWGQTERDLVCLIVRQRENGQIKAASDKEAVKSVAPHYARLQKDGTLKRVDPESAWRNYQKKLRGE
jgi:hypothetical protein